MIQFDLRIFFPPTSFPSGSRPKWTSSDVEAHLNLNICEIFGCLFIGKEWKRTLISNKNSDIGDDDGHFIHSIIYLATSSHHNLYIRVPDFTYSKWSG